MQQRIKRSPKYWGVIWALAWRYSLWMPLVIPLGIFLLVLVCAIFFLPPMIVVASMVMLFQGFWIVGGLVFIVSGLATYFIWRHGPKYLDGLARV